MIPPEELQRGLKSRCFGRRIHSLPTVGSTNTYARSLAASGAEEGTLVIAEEQTEGRGRQGRNWHANPGENLTFSIILRPNIPPGKINLLPLGIAVGAAHGLRRATSLPVCCKWPNDLMLGGRKLAGILMESALGSRGFEYVIAGIGINVNQLVFPEPLHLRATSLALHAGHAFDRTAVLRSLLESLENEYLSYNSAGLTGILPSWLALSPIVGKRVSADMQGTILQGTVTGISPDGGLQLRTETGDLTIFAGDVTILDMESYAPRN